MKKISFLLFLFAGLIMSILLPLRARADVAAPLYGQAITGRMVLTDEPLEDALQVIDYDGFQWAIFSADSRAAYHTNTVTYDLTLGDGVIDTASTANRSIAGSQANLHIIQLIGPTKGEWVTQLEENGLEIVQYIHPFSYVVYGSGEQVARVVRSAEFVHWNAPFDTTWRVLPQFRTNSAESAQYTVVAYRGADQKPITSALQAASRTAVEWVNLNDTWTVTNLFLTDAQLDELAALPGVFSIQPVATDGGSRSEMSTQLIAGNVNGSGLAVPGYPQWLTDVGFDGTDVVVANVDEGVQQNHPDLIDVMIGCTGDTCSTTNSRHGTHTAGIIAGTAASGTRDAQGFLRGQGVAPGVEMFEQDYRGHYTQPGGMQKLMRQSAENGAVLSSNSWGPAGSPRGYDNNTLQVDISVRDALAAVEGDQQFHYILAIMNGGGSQTDGTGTQGTPDEAKNLFAVGSTNMRSGSNQSSDTDSISANSAHGPAEDGRILPHIVAPGCTVISTIPTNSYGGSCGTSMAAPHVAGASALFIERYRALHHADPSPAMLKAALTVYADNLQGNDDADNFPLDHPFNSRQGWGRLNLSEIVSPTVPTLYFDDPTNFYATGQSWTKVVQPADNRYPMRVMLAWTDAPGHGLGGATPAWNNNLDLFLQYDSDLYYGNNIGSDGWTPTGMVADEKNNMEGVLLENPPEFVLINVLAANLNSDGIPSYPFDIDQDFAVACYNCMIPGELPTAVSVSLQQTVAGNGVVGGIASAVIAGSILSYTIGRSVKITGTQTTSSKLTVTPPADFRVLPQTIHINGEPMPEALQPDGTIVYDDPATAQTGTIDTTLSYNVFVEEDAAETTHLNVVYTETEADSYKATDYSTQETTVVPGSKTLLPFVTR